VLGSVENTFRVFGDTDTISDEIAGVKVVVFVFVLYNYDDVFLFS
jgi:hypothetical protein